MKEKIKLVEKETYITPDIEVVDIEIEQNIFAGSDGNLNNMPAENW